MNVFDGHSTVSPRTPANASAASAAPDQLLVATAGSPFQPSQADSNASTSEPCDQRCDVEDLVPEPVQTRAIALIEADREGSQIWAVSRLHRAERIAEAGGHLHGHSACKSEHPDQSQRDRDREQEAHQNFPPVRQQCIPESVEMLFDRAVRDAGQNCNREHRGDECEIEQHEHGDLDGHARLRRGHGRDDREVREGRRQLDERDRGTEEQRRAAAARTRTRVAIANAMARAPGEGGRHEQDGRDGQLREMLRARARARKGVENDRPGPASSAMPPSRLTATTPVAKPNVRRAGRAPEAR